MTSTRARRRFGQHFLTSRAVIRRTVVALDLSPGEGVLEIGPGRGALTAELLATGARVAAVEIDRDLAARLEARFPSLTVLSGDVLATDLSEVTARLELPDRSPLAVAGNLPYNVSKPIAQKIVRDRHRVTRAVLMFQREVADRLTASPGCRDYGPLTVLAGAAYRVERLFDVPPTAFRPKPAVHSTVTRWVVRDDTILDDGREPRLRRCLAACFAHRRKTVLNNLRAELPGGDVAARRLLERAAVDPSVRPEAIPPEAYHRMADHWPVADPES